MDAFLVSVKKDWARNKYKYLIFLPVLIYLALFDYKPLYGIIIAFKQYRPSRTIADSPWVGLENFRSFFGDFYFPRVMLNTFLISLYSIIWGFPVPIIFALMLNELRNQKFKRIVQTASYLPHFISTVVICSIITLFSLSDGLFNDIRVFFGGTRTPILQYAQNFRTIYVSSGIWQSFGWNSIIYLAALASIDQEQYEAAKIDGAGRWRQLLHVTLPGITTTIVMLFILRMGNILSVGAEKILLLYKPSTYETADVISTYTFRRGIINGSLSYATAVGLFNSLVNVVFLLATNRISKRITGTGLF